MLTKRTGFSFADLDQHLGKVLVDSPIAHLVGVSQGVARDLAANAHVVELVPSSSQTGLTAQSLRLLLRSKDSP